MNNSESVEVFCRRLNEMAAPRELFSEREIEKWSEEFDSDVEPKAPPIKAPPGWPADWDD